MSWNRLTKHIAIGIIPVEIYIMYYLQAGKKKIGPLSKAELIMYPFSCDMLVWHENHIDLEMTQFLIQQWEEKEKRKRKRMRNKKS
jgi:hypothetical protein